MSQIAEQPPTRAGMRPAEYAVLEALLLDARPRRSLEVGMAEGGSSAVICDVLRRTGGERHTAIDPFQSDPDHWDGRGIMRVRDAGLGGFLEVLQEPDYLALPSLVRDGRRFDFILIDGWHSFDYTLIDLFYADMLLEVGGVLAIHDTGWPAVFRACRFLETHKAYERIGPPLGVRIPSLTGRLARRAGQILGGSEAMEQARRRRTEWYSLGAYRKLAERQVPNDFYEPF